MHSQEYPHVLLNALCCVVWKADDIGKMADDPVLPAKVHDLTVGRRIVLCFVRAEQSFAAEGFDADKHFETTRAAEQADEFLLFCDLRIALDEKRNADILCDHLLE